MLKLDHLDVFLLYCVNYYIYHSSRWCSMVYLGQGASPTSGDLKCLGGQSEAGCHEHFGWVVSTFFFLLSFVSADAGASESKWSTWT